MNGDGDFAPRLWKAQVASRALCEQRAVTAGLGTRVVLLHLRVITTFEFCCIRPWVLGATLFPADAYVESLHGSPCFDLLNGLVCTYITFAVAPVRLTVSVHLWAVRFHPPLALSVLREHKGNG